MELRDYLAMARRWAWLLAIGLVLGAVVGVLLSLYQSPAYRASTRILVLRAPQEKTTDYTYLSDQQLVQTYIQLLTTRPVLENASARLGYWVSSNQVSVQQIRDTQAIQLAVEDEDPQRAANIANVLVEVLIDQNEIIQASRYTLTEQSIQAQITQIEAQIAQLGTEIENVSAETVVEQQKQVEGQIASLQAEVNQLQAEIQGLSTATSVDQQISLAEKQARLDQILPVLTLYQQIYTDLVVLGKPVSNSGDTTDRLSQLQTTLQLYQEIFFNLLNNLEAIRLARLQNTPNVVQIESATVPSNPIRPRPLMNIGLGAALGLMLAGGIAFLIEYIDDTIRTPEDIDRILKLPVIGYIGDMSDGQGGIDELHVIHRPRSPISEAFRSMRTNLEFTNVDRNLKKILVTSSGPGEGKTTISINLAAIIAQGGRRVLLMDADMRRPRIHTIFGLTNRVGLSVLFRGNSTLRSVMRPVEGVEGVFVITSGNIPPNPTELLASGRMDQILHEASREVDLVIIDSPPSLVAPFQVLAAKADGVLLVIQPGHTRADSAVATLEQLQRVNARTLGVVLNKIPRSSYYYGGYHQYYNPYQRGAYYYQHEESQPQLEGQPMRMLPPARQTHVYYPPQSEFEEQYYVKDASTNPAVQLEHAEDQNEITQPRPAVNPGAGKVDTQEHPPEIEILPPLTFTPYEGIEDE
ncbi:MAG: polysaccharide biosynthesis tyrosine autokinase [Chloroflexi bacterium]|nr:polysaccharide biosynthesis tyrosine autokinase [Chloroflexota bacterium]